jgi:3-phenylpropionate/trans-cinnamate dioxygenase ferredoxin reductase component
MEGDEMIGIVGGGLAAAKVVDGYREAGGDEHIVLVSSDPHPPYHRPPLSKRLLRGEAEPPDALVHPEEWYAEHDVELRLGTEVGSIDELGADRVVLATGARPRRLDGARALRTLDDSLELRRRALEAKTATVIGGGFIGCEVSASLTYLGVKVTHVVREQRLYPALQAPPLSDALADLWREHGVDLRLGVTDTPSVPADLTVAGIGVELNLDVARAAGLEIRQGVVVDDGFESSRPGVYAVGDIAEFYDPVYRRHRRIEHWSTANYHGTQLGKILAGDEDARYSIVSSFFSEVFGYVLRLFGDAAGHDSLDVEGDFREGEAIGRFRRDGHTIAAVTTGQDDETHAELQREIRSGAADASG